ncbi:GTP-binding protein [Bradyrhizobium sp. WSM3983]|uniref:CobW family GTP-binding protein n=1 Tax=Bradyrhizobium sp. WSM3983 TaxID=1038867 RepID=UPI000423F8DD|nr:GTP-binding protein [Bradyrhizobium sp. WSM3983]
MPRPSLIPVSLLTGFLGSGKTTVLNYLLQQPELKNAAVIINEFGEIGLDHDLVESVSENLVLLQNGCLCCTIRDDLVSTFDDLWEKRTTGEIPAFDRVIVETTGLADPAPIIHTLITDQFLAELYRLDGVITTVDAATGAMTLDRQIESVKQAAVADRILVTKVDIVKPDELRALAKRLRVLNPAAPIMPVENGVIDPIRLLDLGFYKPQTKTLDVQAWLNAEAYTQLQNGDDHNRAHEHHDLHHAGKGGHKQGHHKHHHDVNRHDERIRAVCLTVDGPVPTEAFNLWLDILTRLKGPELLRLKAIVSVAESPGPFVLHAVQHVFHPPIQLKRWPSADRRTRLVVIARDLGDEFLRSSLTYLTEAARLYTEDERKAKPSEPFAFETHS